MLCDEEIKRESQAVVTLQACRSVSSSRLLISLHSLGREGFYCIKPQPSVNISAAWVSSAHFFVTLDSGSVLEEKSVSAEIFRFICVKSPCEHHGAFHIRHITDTWSPYDYESSCCCKMTIHKRHIPRFE